MSNINSMVDIWNAGGTVFTAVKMNVTDTASTSGSLLMDLQVGGASKFNVSKIGAVFGDQGFTFTAGSGPGYAYARLGSPNNAGIQLSSISSISWSANAPISGTDDLVLTRDAANTLAQRNGTANQLSRIYGTYTDASNYTRLVSGSFNGSSFTIQTENAGTGPTGSLGFGTAGTQRWIIDVNGNLNGATDNAYDIGASGANRPRNLYVGNNITLANSLLFGATTNSIASNGIGFTFTGAGVSALYAGQNGSGVGYTNVTGFFGFASSGTPLSNNMDVVLVRDAANTLAQRNGTAAQTFNLYNTYTDASNYEKFSITWSGNTVYLQTGNAGTGQRRVMGYNAISHAFYVNDYLRWQFDTNGQFIANTDNTNDIGIAGNAPRYIRAASAIQTKALTVATLPAAATALAGARSFVTDATVATFGSTAVGGGANAVPVWTDGTTWKIG